MDQTVQAATQMAEASGRSSGTSVKTIIVINQLPTEPMPVPTRTSRND